MFYTDPIILPWVWSQINHWLPQTHPTIVSYSVLLTTLNNFYTNQLLSLKQNFVGLQYIYIFATCVCGNSYKGVHRTTRHLWFVSTILYYRPGLVLYNSSEEYFHGFHQNETGLGRPYGIHIVDNNGK